MQGLARLAIVALVITAVVALWWLDTLRRPGAKRPADAAAPHEPDYYFASFRLRAHERPGGPGYVLDGRELLHYADDGTAEVVAPRLRYRPAAGAPWRAAGDTGLLGPDGDRLDIDGNVRLVREAPAGAPLVIDTPRLTVFTAAGRAETDRPVRAVGDGWRAAGTGMTARFGPGLIELHADVRVRHEAGLAGDG